jgi:hypothetical protein
MTKAKRIEGKEKCGSSVGCSVVTTEMQSVEDGVTPVTTTVCAIEVQSGNGGIGEKGCPVILELSDKEADALYHVCWFDAVCATEKLLTVKQLPMPRFLSKEGLGGVRD